MRTLENENIDFLDAAKKAVEDLFGEIEARPNCFGVVLLNGGFELMIRGMLLCHLQKRLDTSGGLGKFAALTELSLKDNTKQSLKNKRADIGIVDSTGARCLIELKGNFTYQYPEATARLKKDTEKWHGLEMPVIHLVLLVEVKGGATESVLKPYVKPSPKHSPSDLVGFVRSLHLQVHAQSSSGELSSPGYPLAPTASAMTATIHAFIVS